MLSGRDTRDDFLRLLFLAGMICPLMQSSIFFDLFWNVKFFISARLKSCLIFSKVPPGSEWWFSAMFCPAEPRSLVFFTGCFEILKIVINRSRFQIMDSSLNWSFINFGELCCGSVMIALYKKQWFLNSSLYFLKIIRVFPNVDTSEMLSFSQAGR